MLFLIYMMSWNDTHMVATKGFLFIYTVFDSLYGLRITLFNYTTWYFLNPSSQPTEEKSSRAIRANLEEPRIQEGAQRTWNIGPELRNRFLHHLRAPGLCHLAF